MLRVKKLFCISEDPFGFGHMNSFETVKTMGILDNVVKEFSF